MVYAALVLGVSAPKTVHAGANVWTSGGPYDGGVMALGIDPTNPSMLYAGTDAGVFKSTDRGTTWTAASSGLSSPEVNAIAIDPTNRATLYAGTYYGDKSTDGGANWGQTNAGTSSVQMTALVIDPRASTTVYAATEFAGVLKSTNGGGAWRSMNSGLTNTNLHALVITCPPLQLSTPGRTSVAVYSRAPMVRVAGSR